MTPNKTTTAGPQVDADPASQQLMIRGTDAQIVQIRELLEKLGENLAPPAARAKAARCERTDEWFAASAALDRIQQIWPSLRARKRDPRGPASGRVFQRAAERQQIEDPRSAQPLAGPKSPAEPAEKNPVPAEKPAAAQPAAPEVIKPAAEDRSAELPFGAMEPCLAAIRG